MNTTTPTGKRTRKTITNLTGETVDVEYLPITAVAWTGGYEVLCDGTPVGTVYRDGSRWVTATATHNIQWETRDEAAFFLTRS